MKTIIGQDIDKLGILLAQISDLTKQANDIKKSLKESTLRELEGALFRAIVVEQDRTTYDVDVLKTAASPEILELAKRESFCVSVKVTARGCEMIKLSVDMLDSEAAVVNVGEDGGYVMVELMDKGGVDHKNIEITVFNDDGEVVSCYSMNLLGGTK